MCWTHKKRFISDFQVQTRYVDGTPMFEVTLVTVQYINPPQHGYLKVVDMVMNDQLASISFHVNQPSRSWNKAISNFDRETSRSRS